MSQSLKIRTRRWVTTIACGAAIAVLAVAPPMAGATTKHHQKGCTLVHAGPLCISAGPLHR